MQTDSRNNSASISANGLMINSQGTMIQVKGYDYFSHTIVCRGCTMPQSPGLLLRANGIQLREHTNWFRLPSIKVHFHTIEFHCRAIGFRPGDKKTGDAAELASPEWYLAWGGHRVLSAAGFIRRPSSGWQQ